MQPIDRDKFRHIPLDRSKECIRLLHFVDQPPCSEHDYFVLETYDIATAPRFVALSYTWGYGRPTYNIIVDDSLLSIGLNLRVALKALRTFFQNAVDPGESQRCEDEGVTLPKNLLQENGYPLLWVDAICIDQSNHLEKNHQVNMMGKIFSAAGCVISWLGEESDNSRCIMKAIRGSMNTRNCSVEVKQAMGRFVRRPYWYRMWIIQEFVLAQNIVILCGDEGAWWKDLIHFWHDTKLIHDAERVRKFCMGYSNQSFPPTGLGALIFARRSRGDSVFPRIGPLSVHELMTTFSYGRCRDRRDRIYALLALIEPQAGAEPLLADYTMSEENLYYRVLRYTGQLDQERNWTGFRTELGKALGSFEWADTESAKTHEVVSEIIEKEFSDEESFKFTLATEAARKRMISFNVLEKKYSHDEAYKLFFADEAAKGRKIFYEMVEKGYPHDELLEFQSATETQVMFTEGQKCLGKHLEQPVDETFSGRKWTFHNFVHHFEAFPRGEDPETWRLFDTLLRRWLKILPINDDLYSLDEQSPYYLMDLLDGNKRGSDISMEHPRTDSSLPSPEYLDYLSTCYISSEKDFFQSM